jgi:hypothetical protein
LRDGLSDLRWDDEWAIGVWDEERMDELAMGVPYLDKSTNGTALDKYTVLYLD